MGVGGFRFQVAGYRSQVAGYRLQVTGHRFAGCKASAAIILVTCNL
jgi:hypothetical protein